MTEKLTSFNEFKRLKSRRMMEVARQGEVARNRDAAETYKELVQLVEQTNRLVKRLEAGRQRELAAAIARGNIGEPESVAPLVRSYERLSWRLYGQLRYILDASRKR